MKRSELLAGGASTTTGAGVFATAGARVIASTSAAASATALTRGLTTWCTVASASQSACLLAHTWTTPATTVWRLFSCIHNSRHAWQHNYAQNWQNTFSCFLEEISARLEFFVLVLCHSNKKINALQNSREQAVDKYWIDTKKERGSLYFSLIPSLQGSLIASAPEISNADSPRRSTL